MNATNAAPADTDTADPNRLVRDNIDLLYQVATVVFRTLGRTVDFDELVSLGTVGLIQAAGRYDATRGASFRTFAYYRIRGSMYDGLGDIGPLPRHIYRRRRVAAERLEQFAASNAVELREGHTATVAAYDALVDAASLFVTSFETAEDMNGPVRATPDCHPDHNLHIDQQRRRVQSALGTLDEKERALLTLRYGEDRTLQDAGAKLGISKSWASRVHAKALRRLRRTLDKQAA